jgi:membrane-bound inhibitor of C-type lysozyme
MPCSRQQDASVTGAANGEGFVTRLTSDGSTLVFSTYFGGNGAEFITSSSVSPTTQQPSRATRPASVYAVTNSTFGGSNCNTDPISRDAFVARLNPGGTSLIFGLVVGGSGYDYANALVTLDDGSTLVAAETPPATFQ